MIVRKIDNSWVVCNYNYLMITPKEAGDSEEAIRNYVHNYIAKCKDSFVANNNTDDIIKETTAENPATTIYSKLFNFVDMLTIGAILDSVKVALWNGMLYDKVMLKGEQYQENVIISIYGDTVSIEIPDNIDKYIAYMNSVANPSLDLPSDDDSMCSVSVMEMNLDYLELFGKPEMTQLINEMTKSVRDECQGKAKDIRNYAGYKEFANYLTDCDLTLLTDEGFGDLLR